MRGARNATAALFALLLVLAPMHGAAAQPTAPSAGDLAIAKGEEAMAAFDRREWELALARFIEADKLYHSPVFSLYQARSLKALGRLVEATAVLEAMREEALPDAAPESWLQAKTEAASELVALKAELPRVVIDVRNARSPRATLDGAAADLDLPIAADPGDHRVTINDGARTMTKMITLRLGSETRAVIDFGAPAPPSPRDSSWMSAGIVVSSVGGAALIAGAVFGGLALGRAATANDALPSSCTVDKVCPTRDAVAIEDSFQPAYDFSHAADGLLVSGGVLAATGVLILLVDATSGPSAPVAADARGITLRF